jgi:hypothetical protein
MLLKQSRGSKGQGEGDLAAQHHIGIRHRTATTLDLDRHVDLSCFLLSVSVIIDSSQNP